MRVVRSLINSPYVLFSLRTLIAALFLFAGIPKLLDLPSFALAIYNYHLLPNCLINFGAMMIASIEVVCGLFLLLGIWTRSTSTILTGLTSVFAFGIVSAWWRGLSIDCGCFIGFKEEVGILTLGRDLLLLVLLLWLLVKNNDKWRLPSLLSSRPTRSASAKLLEETNPE